MAISVNDKDLGLVTAYAYAVAGGYTGTEAEFKELLGNIAEDLSEIENLSVNVETLPAGSSAKASYSHGILYLGIPRGNIGATGATGATGPQGPQGIPGDVANLAAAYSTSATYAVDDYVIYNNQLYRCTTVITTAEAWTAAHWTAVVIGNDVSNLKRNIDTNTADITQIKEQDFSPIARLQIARTIDSRQMYRAFVGADVREGNLYKISITKINNRITGDNVKIRTTTTRNVENTVEEMDTYAFPAGFKSVDMLFKCTEDGAKYFSFSIATDPGNLGLNIVIYMLKPDQNRETAQDTDNEVYAQKAREGEYFGVDAAEITAGSLSGYIVHNGVIGSGGVWANADQESYEGIIIPIPCPGAVLRYTTSSGNETDAIICGLQDFSLGYKTGDAVAVATTPTRQTMAAGTTRAFYLSDDCQYLYVSVKYIGKAVNFSSFSISWTNEQKRGLVNRLNDYAGRGPVMAFIDDDGFSAAIQNWEELADATGIRLSFALITGSVGVAEYMTTWGEVERLMGKGHEFISHTNGHINLSESTDEQIIADSAATTAALRTHGCTGPMYLVYPFGPSPLHISDTIQKYFVAGVKTENYSPSGHNYNIPPLSPFEIYRQSICSDGSGTKETRTIDGQTYNLFVYKTLAEMKAIIDEVIEKKAFLVWMTHLRQQPTEGYWYDDDIRDTLIGAIEYAAEKGVKVLTFGEGYEMCKNRIATENEIVDCDGIVHDLS